MPIWEMIIGGLLVAAVLWWFTPGVRRAVEQSRQAEKDWPAVVLPLGLVFLFVLLLLSLV